jgi:hypothetical protein
VAVALSTADIEHLASVLAQGKRPKVVFTDAAGQVAGRSGKVVELGSPREGDFVVVAFGSDQLSFAPGELRLPVRGEGAKAKVPRQSGPAGPGLLPEEEPRRAAAEEREERVQVSAAEGESAEKPVRKRAARPKAKDKHAELTVTLTYDEGSWEVAASRGARQVVRPHAVSHAAALAMCQASESDDVRDIVDEVVERIRAEAAEQAEVLRKRLEEAEARLAELG